MGLLTSRLFSKPDEDPKLEACLIKDPAHVTPGSRGDHVKKIQVALTDLSRAVIFDKGALLLKWDGSYNTDTATAVKTYKDAPARKILQPWQTSADPIVGKRTIKSLDDEMFKLENLSKLVSATSLGAPHDHSKCPKSDFPGNDGLVHHLGTPINPKGGGRKINIGGEDETKYLGFEDFVTDPKVVGGPARPITTTLPDKCASDICLRSSPLTSAGKREVVRIAQSGCRLTFASNGFTVTAETPFLLSLGTLEQRVSLKDKSEPDGLGLQIVVISMR